jgi:hypothetical protein
MERVIAPRHTFFEKYAKSGRRATGLFREVMRIAYFDITQQKTGYPIASSHLHAITA